MFYLPMYIKHNLWQITFRIFNILQMLQLCDDSCGWIMSLQNITLGSSFQTVLKIVLSLSCSGRGTSIMVSITVCQAGRPGLSITGFVCFRKVEFYQHVIDLSPPVPTTGSPKTIHVLTCLCDNACKRFLVTCHKSRASCPVSRLLSVPI